jgi:hypothetical protein
MSKTKLLLGAVITVFALGTTTGMVSAAVKHSPEKAEKAKPAPVVGLAPADHLPRSTARRGRLMYSTRWAR